MLCEDRQSKHVEGDFADGSQTLLLSLLVAVRDVKRLYR